GDAFAAVLGHGTLGGDADGAAGGDHGQPVVDVLCVLQGGTGAGRPEGGGGGPGGAVHYDRAVADLVQPDGAAPGPRVVGGQGAVAAFVADHGAGEAALVGRGADHGQVAEAFRQA